MNNIEVIKHIICYDQKDFITQLVATTNILQKNNLEVDIQYSADKEIYSALIIGKKELDKKNEPKARESETNINKSKTNGNEKSEQILKQGKKNPK